MGGWTVTEGSQPSLPGPSHGCQTQVLFQFIFTVHVCVLELQPICCREWLSPYPHKRGQEHTNVDNWVWSNLQNGEGQNRQTPKCLLQGQQYWPSLFVSSIVGSPLNSLSNLGTRKHSGNLTTLPTRRSERSK